MYPSNAGQDRRATFLSVLFGLVGAATALAILFALCGGLTAYVLAVVGGTATLGYIHYFLWGRSFNREVAGEREELGELEQLNENRNEDEYGYRE
jgi:hypothetical protein